MNNHQPPKPQDPSFDEAPASWNTRIIDPNGFECQITLRGENGTELMEKANNAIVYLLQSGCSPFSYRSYNKAQTTNSEQKPNPEPHEEQPNWCPIHGCEMKRWEKEGRVWYSHKINGSWCTGKAS